MADQTESSTTVDAPPAHVMAVIEDFAAYPEWAGEVRSADVTAVGDDGRPAEVRFVMDAGVIKDEYTLRYDWSGADRVTWTLVDGKLLTELDGSYDLAATPDGGTEVTYRLSVGVAHADAGDDAPEGRARDHRPRAGRAQEAGGGLTCQRLTCGFGASR